MINRLAYDLLADDYLRRSESPSRSQESPEFLAGLLLRHAVGMPRVLEIGPGSGEVLHCLENRSLSALGVELSPRMAELAARRLRQSPVVIGNILEIGFPIGSFDAVYAGAVLHLFPDQDARALLRRIHTWLSPGGVLFANTSVGSAYVEGFQLKEGYGAPVARYRIRWTEPQFRNLLVGEGFEILERATTDEMDRSKTWIAYIVRRKL